jgi:hypothetical protein
LFAKKKCNIKGSTSCRKTTLNIIRTHKKDALLFAKKNAALKVACRKTMLNIIRTHKKSGGARQNGGGVRRGSRRLSGKFYF